MAGVDVTLVPGVIVESGSAVKSPVNVTLPTASIIESGTAIKSPVNITLPTATITESGRLGIPVGITLPVAVIYEMGIATTAPYVYVVDAGNSRVNAYDYNGVFKFSFGSYGTGNGQFDNPYGIDTNGTYVYVTDSGNNRVQIFTMFGVYVGQFGSEGSGNGEFSNPLGIRVDDRYIWVVDSNNNRFQVFDLWDYTFYYKLGEYGSGTDQFDAPTDCWVDDVYFRILDAGNGGRIIAYPKNFPYEGIGESSLAALTGSAEGETHTPGRGVGILPPFTLEAGEGIGTTIQQATGAPELAGFSSSGEGITIAMGSSTADLPALESDGDSISINLGSGSPSLPAVESSGVGISINLGTSAGQLAALIVSAGAETIRATPTYFGVAVNMRNKGITDYSGFDFNSFAILNGKLYGASTTGIHLLEGADDNGTDIDAHIKTGTIDLHSENVRRIVDAWLTLRINGNGTFTVYEDEESTGYSEAVNVDNELMHDERVKLAKGLKGRFDAFEFANAGGSDFDLAGLAVNTREITKRQR
jgi:hypothetical protein